MAPRLGRGGDVRRDSGALEFSSEDGRKPPNIVIKTDRLLIIGALERRVLDRLWRLEGAVRVRELSPEFPGLAYTTLMTTLDRLYRKGVLRRERDGRAFRYRADCTREELDARIAAGAVAALFALQPGAIRPALSFLVRAAGREDQSLLDELDRLVRERRRDREDVP